MPLPRLRCLLLGLRRLRDLLDLLNLLLRSRHVRQQLRTTLEMAEPWLLLHRFDVSEVCQPVLIAVVGSVRPRSCDDFFERHRLLQEAFQDAHSGYTISALVFSSLRAAPDHVGGCQRSLVNVHQNWPRKVRPLLLPLVLPPLQSKVRRRHWPHTLFAFRRRVVVRVDPRAPVRMHVPGIFQLPDVILESGNLLLEESDLVQVLAVAGQLLGAECPGVVGEVLLDSGINAFLPLERLWWPQILGSIAVIGLSFCVRI